MKWHLRLSEKNIKKNRIFSPARIIVLGFLGLILIGATLLNLPISTQNGIQVDFLTAFFTATSATCVTGLVVVDTATTWSMFGKVVILCLIQIGGLGFMSVMTIIFFITRRTIGLSQRLLIVQSLSLKDITGVVKLVKRILIGTFVVEIFGAIILWARFSFDFGVRQSLGMGIWHSVSAFCNAGFDLMGYNEPFSSMTAYSGDIIVSLTLMLLVIVGGVGFYVWEDIWCKRSFKKLNLHSKMVITITIILILFGWIFFFLAERTNINTMANMSTLDKIIASFFQSVSTRTAGFNSIDQGAMTDVSKIVTMLLMFIGGSSGSTAGGIKTVTMGILVLSAISSLRGKRHVSVYGRTITTQQILSAFSVMIIATSFCFISSIAISVSQEIPYFDALFETISAIGTVGLTTGITSKLNAFSQVIIIFMMFFGRVGIMTIGLAATLNRNNTEKIKYPDAWIMLG